MNKVEAISRSWLGTPFVAGASVKGVGADCAGLIEGIARELGMDYPSRSEVEQDFVRAADAVLIPIVAPQSGALILMSKEPGSTPIHAAIWTSNNTLIHAHWRAGVVENRFGSWFKRRTTHVFAWPHVADLRNED
jgi:NlpC/P60 family putative phage cell wall peptidase